MYYSDINEIDTTNGFGVGVSIFVSGCRNHCKGCFQPETWNFKFGQEFTDEKKKLVLDLVSRPYIDFFSVLGGDPFEPENIPVVLDLVNNVKSVNSNLKIFIWSGYLYEDLMSNESTKALLDVCDYLIDGRFELDKRDLHLKLRGSSNQRIVSLKESSLSNIVELKN